MSNNQKMLKIMSFLTVVMAVVMAWHTGTSFFFANTSVGLLLCICALVVTLLDAALGYWGVGAANKPARSTGVYYIALAWLALVLNVVALVVYVLLADWWIWQIIANVVVIALYVFYLRGVRKETLK